MKAKTIFSFLGLLLSLSSFGQNFSESWARTAGGSGDDMGMSVAVDHHGGVYVAGTFKSASFAIGSTTLLNAGGNDIFIAKFDTSGNFLWANRYGGSGHESVGRMVVEPDGTIYISDTFRTNISLGNYSFNVSGNINDGIANLFLAKITSTGSVAWVEVLAGNVQYPDLAFDLNNNIYLAGFQRIGSSANFIVNKYNSQGSFQFTKSFPTHSSARQKPQISVDWLNQLHLIHWDLNLFVFRKVYDSTGILLNSISVPGGVPGGINYHITDYKARYPGDYYFASAWQSGTSKYMYLGNNSSRDSYFGCEKSMVNTELDDLGYQFSAGTIFTPGVDCNGGPGYALTHAHGGPFTPGIGDILAPTTFGDIYYTSRTYNAGNAPAKSTSLNGKTSETAQWIALDTAAYALYIVGDWVKSGGDTSKFYFGNSTLVNAGNGSTKDFLLLKYSYQPNVLTLNAGPDKSICPGGSTFIGNASTGGTGPYSYSWSPATGLSSTTVASPTANPTATTTYVVTATDGGGNSITDTVKVTVDPTLFMPTISIAQIGGGTNPFCEGTGYVGLMASAGSNYLWSNGNTNQHIFITETDTLTVTQINSAGCIGTSLPFYATMIPRTPTPTIQNSGSNAICTGDTRTLTAVSSQSPATFLWNNNATTPSITVSNPGTYNVTATGPGGCPSLPASVTLTGAGLPGATITASGPTSFCNGDSVGLSVTTSPANTIMWGTGETTSSIWAKNSGSYSATVTSPQGCTTVSNSITVTVLSLPAPPTIMAGGPTTFCVGGSVLLTAQSPLTGVSYQWNTGATSAAISVANGGIYSVTATDAQGCKSATASIPISINPLPTGFIAATGNTSICQGDSVLLTATTAAGNGILWSTGAVGTSIWVKATGNYNAAVTSPDGCSITTNTVSVTVTALPAAPLISASGPVSFCAGGSVILTAQTTGSGISYIWNTGSASNTITATTAGSYSVKAINNMGCISAPAGILVTVHSLPTATIAASGNTILCSGDSVQLSVSTAPANSILWNNGSSSSAIWVHTAGAHYASVSSPQGCSQVSNSITVSVNPLPTPVISQTGNVLTVSPAAQTYQWFYNGSPIQGATSQSLTTSQGGTYSIAVTDNGCEGTATWSSVWRNTSGEIAYQVYPNPSTDEITVAYTLTESARVNVKLFDMLGQRVFNIVDNQVQSAGDHQHRINNSKLRLQPGFYTLLIQAGDKKIRHRVIVL